MINILEIAFFVILGLLLRRLRLDSARLAAILNRAAVYLALPALILLKIPELNFSVETLIIALFAWGMVLMSVLVILIAARRLAWSRAVTGTLLMVVPLGNTGFMGVPMIKAFFGDAGLPHLIIYDQLGTLLILVSYGSFIAARYGDGQQGIEIGTLLRRIFLFPPMISFLVALTLRGVAYPHGLVLLFQAGALALTPLVMTAIGLQLKVRMKRNILIPFGYGMTIKLLLAPLLVFLVCRLFGLSGLAYDVTVLEAGMPPMITAGAMAIAAKMDADLAVAMSGLGIVIAFLSLPLIYFVLI